METCILVADKFCDSHHNFDIPIHTLWCPSQAWEWSSVHIAWLLLACDLLQKKILWVSLVPFSFQVWMLRLYPHQGLYKLVCPFCRTPDILSHKLVHVWLFWEQQQLPKHTVVFLDMTKNSDTAQRYIITFKIVVFCCFSLKVTIVLTYTVHFKFLNVFILIKHNNLFISCIMVL